MKKIAIILLIIGVLFIIYQTKEVKLSLNSYKDTLVLTNDIIETPQETPVISDILEFIDGDQKVEPVKQYKNALVIPKLKVETYIYKGVTEQALNSGVGLHENTAKLGTLGTSVIAGHGSATYKCIFNELHKLDLFDTFDIYDSTGTKHTYTVIDKNIISPYSTDILYNSGVDYHDTILYTCTDNGKKRLAVKGRKFTPEELNLYKRELQKEKYKEITDTNNSLEIPDIISKLDFNIRSIYNYYNFTFYHKFTKSIKEALVHDLSANKRRTSN